MSIRVRAVILGSSLSLVFMAHATPNPSGVSTAQPAPTISATPATRPTYDPNAPKGMITFTASSKNNVNASTWYTGSFQYVAWTCNGTASNAADVTLWKNDQQYATIATKATAGTTTYLVPLNAAPGVYELRVTSTGDRRVEARKSITVAFTTATLASPPATLVSGSSYTINWSYTSNPNIKLSMVDASGALVQEYPNVATGVNGKGVWPISVPVPPTGKTSFQCRFRIVGTFRTSIANQDKTDVVLSTSSPFTITCPGSATACNGVCKNLTADLQNCGACGNVCSAQRACVSGKCECKQGLTNCSNVCSDLSSDDSHCGTCTRACVDNDFCSGGTCKCKQGYGLYGGRCVPGGHGPVPGGTSSSGNSGTSRSKGSSSGGSPCPSNQVLCGTRCIGAGEVCCYQGSPSAWACPGGTYCCDSRCCCSSTGAGKTCP